MTTSPSGFTNVWLTSRRPEHYFDQRYRDHQLFQQTPTDPRGFMGTTIVGHVERNPLGDGFFSAQNVETLKNASVAIIRQSGYQIDARDQSTTELLTVMKSIYLSDARHDPRDVAGQIKELNSKVIAYIVPRMITNIKAHLAYMRDASQQPLVMDRPQYVSSSGTKSNPGRVW